jgi:hypothetical protein
VQESIRVHRPSVPRSANAAPGGHPGGDADDLDQALGGILAAAVAGLGASGGAILLTDPDRTESQRAASVGFTDGEIEALAAAADTRTSCQSRW